MSKILFPTALDCETAFYDAFERADLNLMMTTWADEPGTVCIHPQGPRLAGINAIRASFAEIFSPGANALISVSELRRQQSQTLAIHSVYETISPRRKTAENANLSATMLTTNVYLLTPVGWRMIMHHASPAPRGSTAADQGVNRILH